MSAQFRMRSFNSPNGIANSGGHCLSRAFDWVFEPPRFADQAGGRAQLVQESLERRERQNNVKQEASRAGTVGFAALRRVRQSDRVCHAHLRLRPRVGWE